MPQNTIRTRHMKMKIRNRIFAQILLPTLKLISYHLSSLHEDLFLSECFEIKGGGADGFEDGDSTCDASLEFGEGGYVIVEVDVWEGEDSNAEESHGVGHGLYLVGEPGSR